MNIIEGLGFSNFRIFTNPANLDFAPITVLTGTNNSGKSTVINGMRLINANFNKLTFSESKKEDFEIDSLFKNEFVAEAIIQRYGSLEKMISFGSKEGKFSFCIQKKMRMINDIALIEFSIAIQNNRVKNGRLAKIIMKSKNTGEEIFSIEEVINKPHSESEQNEYYSYVTKINLIFYHNHFLKWIEKNLRYYNELYTILQMTKNLDIDSLELSKVENKIRQVNLEYESTIQLNKNQKGEYSLQDDRLFFVPDIGIEPNELKKISTELKNGLFYDFSFLWEKNPEQKKLFTFLIKKIYGEYSKKNLAKLNEDILKYLTEFNWEKMPKFSQYEFSHSLNGINNRELNLNSLIFKCIKPGEFAFLSFDRIEKINDSNELVVLLIDMIDERNKVFNSEEFGVRDILSGDPAIKEKIKKGKYMLPGLTASESEKYFNETFLFHNLNLIKECFEPFKVTEFISADRANSNRVKSMLEKDDLSRLTKNLFFIDNEPAKDLEEFIDTWFRIFGIADKVTFEKDDDSENFKIFTKKNSQTMLLADMGYGATQLLPIILACFPKIENDYYLKFTRTYKPKVVVIEEPESNLHPALQSKLADFFIAASKKFNIQFIIETHSEYLIRKLQYLTAKGEIETSDTIIYYFYPPENVSEAEDQIKRINIQEDGSLSDDFGSGFFDEADNIALDLFLLKPSQKN